MAVKIRTVTTYNLDGVTTSFTIPFEYLARKFVTVTLIGTDRKELVLNQDYRFSTKTQITTSVAWGTGSGYQLIEIRRFTSATERLVDFSDGSILRAYDLNISQIQTLQVAEEARDLMVDSLTVNDKGELDARGRHIVNVADGVADGDVITIRQMKAWDASALNASKNAKQSEDNARLSALNAHTSSVNSKSYMDSSKGYRDESEQFAKKASESEVSATTSARNAKSSESVAKESESFASVSAGEAKKSEVNSKASEEKAYEYMLNMQGDPLLRGDLKEHDGAKLIGTPTGTLQDFIDKGLHSTSQLNIKNGTKLLEALVKYGGVIVDTTVEITEHFKIPQGRKIVSSGYGRLVLKTPQSTVECTAFSHFDCPVIDESPSEILNGAIMIRGAVESPRLYVAEMTMYIKSHLRSSKRDSKAVFFNGISTEDSRGIISGVEVDVTVSKFKYGIYMKTDNTAFKGSSGGAYITSNRISIVAGGTSYCVYEEYSTGTVKPQQEEIGGNMYYIEYQPVETYQQVLRSVGRITQYEMNVWDNHAATNKDQFEVHGNDNTVKGTNLPAANSEYVKITGKNNEWSGHTYGTPISQVVGIEALRSINTKWGDSRLTMVGALNVLGSERPVTGSSAANGVILFERNLGSDILARTPLTLEIRTITKMEGTKSVNFKLSINGHDFYHGGSYQIANNLMCVTLMPDSVRVMSSINNSNDKYERFATITGDVKIALTVWDGSDTGVSGSIVYSTATLNYGSI